MQDKHDEFVQATNNSSIVSKRSVEELYYNILYPNHPDRSYFDKFVPKFKRRSPVINRGYLLRLLIIKQTLIKIVQRAEELGKNVTVVNLGCGYDPIAFEFLDLYNIPNLKFVDIDYHALIDHKVRMIRNSEKLCHIIGYDPEITPVPSSSQYKIETLNYSCVQCDLNDAEAFVKVKNTLNWGVEDNLITVFIAEVSITYMEPEKSDDIIKHCLSVPNSHFLILEQIIKDNDRDNKFVKLMLRHFNKVNSPIKSIANKYHTLDQQHNRFQKLSQNGGSNKANSNGNFETITMMQYWNDHVSDNLKKQTKLVEGYDEYEEFTLFCHHYYIGHYSTNGVMFFQKTVSNDKVTKQLISQSQKSVLPLKIIVQEPTDDISRRFPAACRFGTDSILLNSGFADSRLNSTSLLTKNTSNDLGGFQLTSSELPAPRTCHAMVQVSETSYMLLGGRTSPENILSDCWILDILKTNDKVNKATWTRTKDMPLPRYRMNAFVRDLCVYIINGSVSNGDILKYDVILKEWESINTTPLLPRVGAAVAICEDQFNLECENNKENKSITGYITGGFLDDNGKETIDTSIYKFTIVCPLKNVQSLGTAQKSVFYLERLYSSELFQRYGAALTISPNGKLIVLIGGVARNYSLDRSTTLLEYDLEEKKIKTFEISLETWKSLPLLMNGSFVEIKNNLKTYVSGGAVCYSFGSYWSGVVQFGFEDYCDIKLHPFDNILLIKTANTDSYDTEFLKENNKTEKKPSNTIAAAVIKPKSPVLMVSEDGNAPTCFNACKEPLLCSRVSISAFTQYVESFENSPISFENATPLDISGMPIVKGALINKAKTSYEFFTNCKTAENSKINDKVFCAVKKLTLSLNFIIPVQKPYHILQVSGSLILRVHSSAAMEVFKSLGDIKDIFSKNPKLEQNTHSSLKDGDVYECTLKSGDQLVIPAGWGWCLRTLERSVFCIKCN